MNPNFDHESTEGVTKKLISLITVLLLTTSQSAYSLAPVGGAIPLFQIPAPPEQAQELPKFEALQPAQAPAPAAAETTEIRVNQIRITGNPVFSENELLAITAFVPESDLTLDDLRGIAGRITSFYRNKGYFLTQAYLPAQEIENGVVTVAVVVGEYGEISINNQTNTSVGLTQALISDVDRGDLIESGSLETSLLLLSDLAGVEVSSTLVPGDSPGTSDLNIDLTSGPRVTGSLDSDNAGLSSTGKIRFGTTINVNNLAGLGDVASLRALSSGSGMFFGRASYQFQIGRATLGAAYAQINYKLGEEFSELGVNGTAKIVSVFGSYPLIRSRYSNLYAQFSFDRRENEDKIDLVNLVTRKRTNVLMPSIYGDHRDDIGSGGISSYGLTLYLGNLDLQTPATKSIDQATAKTNGQFAKLAFNAMRLQKVTETVSFYAAINGQISSKNLDVWEKMELGGLYGVRAYPAGTAFGDQGYILNLEARLLLPSVAKALPGNLYLLALFDTGTVQRNKNPWAGGDNTVTLSGAGVGVMWSEQNNFSIKTYYARKVGKTPNTVETSSAGQFWFQLIKYF